MKTVFIGLLAILFLTSSIWIFPGSGENDEILQDQTIPETVDEIITRSYDSEGSHLFTNITITSDSELKKFIQDGNFTGSGTESDPYLIKDLETNNTDYNIIPYIHISNTTSHVVFENITIDERNYFKISTTKFRIADCSNMELREIDIDSRYGPSFEMLRSNSISISDYSSDLRYDDENSDFVIIEAEDILIQNFTSRDGIIIDLARNLTIRKPSQYTIRITNSSEIRLVESAYAQVYLTVCSEVFLKDFSTQLLIFRVVENITFDSCNIRYTTIFYGCENLKIVNSSFSSYSTIQDSKNITIHDNYRIYFYFYRCEVIEIFNNSLDQTDYFTRIALSDCSNTSIINNLLTSLTLSKSMDCVVSENIIRSNYPYGGFTAGIAISGTMRTRIEENVLNNVATGIFLYSGSTENVISGNVIDGSSTGIHFNQNQLDVRNTISDNIIRNCSYGSLSIGQYHGDLVYGNTMTGAGINIAHNLNSDVNVEISSNNTLNGKPVLSILDEDMGGAVIEDEYSQYLLFNASNVIFRNFTHQNAYKGPVVHMSSNVTFENFNVVGSEDWGFLLTYSENVTLDNCSIDNTTRWPILSSYNDNLVISETSIVNKEYQDTTIIGGYFLMEDCTFETNGNITMNVRDSVMIDNAFNISENRVFNILSSIYLTFYNNTFRGSGIQFDGILNGYQLFDIPLNNTLNGDPILLLQDMNLHGSEINASGKGQIILVNASNVMISDQIVDERGHYLSLMNSRNITMENITAVGCKQPIRSFDSRDIFVENCSFENGITLLYSFYDDENISFCGCRVNEFNSGLNIHYGYYSTNINISENKFENCSRPVRVYLTKSLTMINNSLKGRRPVMEGPDPFNRNEINGIHLDGITEGKISGNRIEGFYFGIYLVGEHTKIKDNSIVRNELDGAYLRGQKSVLTGNEISHNLGNGIVLYYQSGSIVRNNDCSFNGKTGIAVFRGGINTIENNDCSFCGYGLMISDRCAYGNVFKENYIEGCSDAGIYIAESGQLLYSNILVNCGFDIDWLEGYDYHADPYKSNKTITIPANNTVNGVPVFVGQHERNIDVSGDWSQIFLFNVSGIVHDVSMSVPLNAMKIIYSNGLLFEDIEITGVQRGLYADHCERINVKNVTISDSATGMEFERSHMNITGCVMDGNTIGIHSTEHEDVRFEHGEYEYPIIRDSVFSNNEVGLEITNSYNSFIVTENEFRGNQIGIMDLAGSSVTMNYFLENTGPAIFLQSNSHIVKNHFEDNNPGGVCQVVDNRSFYHSWMKEDAWFDPGVRIGNLWSDLTGPDYDGDGIIDVPYHIYAENGTRVSADEYPLTSLDIITAPEDFQVWSFEKGTAHLSWKPLVSGNIDLIDGYRIYRGNDTVDMEMIAELDEYWRNHWYTEEFEDRGLDPNTEYQYYLVAFKGVREGIPTETISVVPDGDPGFISITSPGEGDIFTETEVEVSWNIEEIAPIDMEIDLRLTKNSHTVERWHGLDINESPLLLTNLSEGRYYLNFEVPGPGHEEYDLKVYFYVDTAPPEISNLEPEEGSVVGGTHLHADWSVRDNGSGIAFSTVKLDDGDYIDPELLNGSSYWIFHDLEGGPHTITVLTVDRAGRQTTATSNFTVDLDPCVFEFTGPPHNGYVNSRYVEVGWREVGNWSDFDYKRVYVREYRGGSSYTSIDFMLDDTNRTISFESDRDRTVSVIIETRDFFDNEYERYLNFTIDTLRPELKMLGENIDIPLTGSLEFEASEIIEESKLRFSGLDEGDFTISAENDSIIISPTVPMDPGRTYTFSIEGEDLAGNPFEENEFNFTVNDKGQFRMYLLSNETGHRINAYIYLNRTDGSQNIMDYFSSFTGHLTMGQWELKIVKDGYHPHEEKFTIKPGEVLDLGNITLKSIPGFEPGPGPSDDDIPFDDDDDQEEETEDKEEEYEIPYSLILIVLLVIFAILLVITLVRKARKDQLDSGRDDYFFGVTEE